MEPSADVVDAAQAGAQIAGRGVTAKALGGDGAALRRAGAGRARLAAALRALEEPAAGLALPKFPRHRALARLVDLRRRASAAAGVEAVEAGLRLLGVEGDLARRQGLGEVGIVERARAVLAVLLEVVGGAAAGLLDLADGLREGGGKVLRRDGAFAAGKEEQQESDGFAGARAESPGGEAARPEGRSIGAQGA